MFISAVIPVYNSVNTLERAINSLLIQSEINEIIIVDDGSIDGTFELAKNLEANIKIIYVLTHEGRINRGASASRNLGLKHCSNDWIQFLDADDELLPNKIKEQISLIKPNDCLVIGPIIWNSNNKLKKTYFDRDIWNGLLNAKLGITSSNLWNKSIIDEVGGWNEELINTQEYELLFRICKVSSSVKFCTKYLTIIHVTPNSLTRSSFNVIPRLNNQYKLRKDILNFIDHKFWFTIPYKINFSGYIGTMLRNHNYIIELKYSKFYYFVYKFRKSIFDRYKIYFKN